MVLIIPFDFNLIQINIQKWDLISFHEHVYQRDLDTAAPYRITTAQQKMAAPVFWLHCRTYTLYITFCFIMCASKNNPDLIFGFCCFLFVVFYATYQLPAERTIHMDGGVICIFICAGMVGDYF